jgi:hypothetical protein
LLIKIYIIHRSIDSQSFPLPARQRAPSRRMG